MFRALFLMLLLIAASLQAEEPLQGYPEYMPAQLEQNQLSSVGSDSMGGLMDHWVAAYKELQPSMAMDVLSRGSASAPAALIEGRADIGPMARPMKGMELESFKLKYGFEPTQIKTAYAAVGVYVSEKNPITRISLQELDALYSATRIRGAETSPLTWRELGVIGALAKNNVMPIGRPEQSFPFSYFRQKVLLQEDFRKEVVSSSELSATFEILKANPNAIAYGEVTENFQNAKLLQVSKNKQSVAIAPTHMNIRQGRYPLSRSLNVSIVRTPGEKLDKSVADFLRFILSQQGQEIVQKQGLLPLSPGEVKEERAKLG